MADQASRSCVSSSSAEVRQERAARWLARQGSATEVIIVAATLDGAADLTRAVGSASGGFFGWHRFTLAQLAWALARTSLAQRGLVPVGGLALAALSARVVHAASAKGTLGRFAAIESRPGLPRALASTLSEVRLAKADPAGLGDPGLAGLASDFDDALVRTGLADRAVLFEAALAVIRAGHPLLGKPVLLLDVPLNTAAERDLAAALSERTESLLVTVPTGDARTLRYLAGIPGLATEVVVAPQDTTLGRIQANLFAEEASGAGMSHADAIEVFSAPGESRECVEIARRVHRAAERGVPFDRMAVLLRSPLQYRAHIEEAFRRASIPVHFARGTARPDPAGRAFLALLACASEGLSASRFAEYLSIGEVPPATESGAPPVPTSSADRWVPADDDLQLPGGHPTGAEDAAAVRAPARDAVPALARPVLDGTLRAPRLWERLIVDAAVIGGLGRWKRRLAGLQKELEIRLAELEDPTGASAAGVARQRNALLGLTGYALPLLDELAALPRSCSWAVWIERLEALATRALARPTRVLAVLAELRPMGEVGPIELTEVRFALEHRLAEVVVPETGRRYGHVYVASTEEARGLAFDVVFVPGLAEKLFPRKIMEDPILPDRARTGTELVTNAGRGVAERLALRIAVGAATKRVAVSYPRLDVEQARPRTPSFYGLEVLRAAEGQLPDFDALARRADSEGSARVGWPAPASPTLAIDDAEHDLALLESVLRQPEAETVGTARYLLSSNVHLARALRARAKRSLKKWTEADGLVSPGPAALQALAGHGLDVRSYSPTGLQNYAACPYRFLLQAIHRLSPREDPQPVEDLDPLQRGSLIHEVQFEVYGTLRDLGLLPVTPMTLEVARGHLERVIDRVVARYREDLAPAIDRVWDDGVARVRADLREWLRRAAEDPTFVPAFFELAFGLTSREARDPRSVKEPVALDCGIKLRGSIDLVERRTDGALRATDHKSGKKRADDGVVIGGGEVLQPVLYALALEKLHPDHEVVAGRLYYCTSVGDFSDVVVPLDGEARQAAEVLASAVGDAVTQGFLPAAPARGACEYCDYRAVCGPGEEVRTAPKKRDRLVLLDALRARP